MTGPKTAQALPEGWADWDSLSGLAPLQKGYLDRMLPPYTLDFTV